MIKVREQELVVTFSKAISYTDVCSDLCSNCEIASFYYGQRYCALEMHVMILEIYNGTIEWMNQARKESVAKQLKQKDTMERGLY